MVALMVEKIPLVAMKGIDKIFYGAYANKGVDFDLYAGEVHSILGENGAGKTTLMNCLAGIYAPDAGVIEIEGRPVTTRRWPESEMRVMAPVVPKHTVPSGPGRQGPAPPVPASATRRSPSRAKLS